MDKNITEEELQERFAFAVAALVTGFTQCRLSNNHIKFVLMEMLRELSE